MKSAQAVAAFGALAHAHRLAIARLLIQAGQEGLPAGAVADALGVPSSSLSFHLAELRRAGLIRQERQSRRLIYSADGRAISALAGYLLEQCWSGGVRSNRA